jgi:dihydrofolate reductase
MGIVRFQVSVSLDGYLAGPDQTIDDPLGVGGEDLHRWMFDLEIWRRQIGEEGGIVNESSAVLEEAQANVGAYVMGRKMFGGGPGPWNGDPEWKGWWGDDPPYHSAVFVLTHHPRDPLMMQGGTTFHFVTDGPESALVQAREAAGERDVAIAGGAKTIQQYLAAGAVDEFELHVAPQILGGGERLLENVGDLRLEELRVIGAPGVAHVKYRVLK